MIYIKNTDVYQPVQHFVATFHQNHHKYSLSLICLFDSYTLFMKAVTIFLVCILLTISGRAQIFSTDFQDPPYPYYDGHKWGITDMNRQVRVAPQYDSILYFRATLLDLYSFKADTFALVRKGKKLGAIDLQGNVLTPCNYDRLEHLYWGIARGKQNGKYAILNLKTRKQVTPAVYDSVADHCSCTSRIFRVWQRGKQGYINADTGKLVTPIIYDKVDYVEGMDTIGLVIKNKKCGLVSLMSGKELLPLVYDTITPMCQNSNNVVVVAAHASGTTKYFDWWWQEVKFADGGKNLRRYNDYPEESKEETPPGPKIGTTSSRILSIYKQGNDNWKVNEEDLMNDPPKIYNTFELSGFSSVKLIPTEERPAKYALLLVRKNGKAGIIRPTGEEVIPFIYDDIVKTAHYYKTTLNGKVGMLDGLVLTTIKKPVLKRILEKEGDTFEKASNVGSMNAWLVELPDGKKGFMIKANGRLLIPGM